MTGTYNCHFISYGVKCAGFFIKRNKAILNKSGILFRGGPNYPIHYARP